ncbi:EthD domain-containing protein [Novosphingobium album (ex Hu et al. 2023)]|uniref:EthD domain-containing protein n=1 Tax=Novosphingobium album (ex Hu et al. 2023) TaxID=2930093 RepID=A0ABT0AZ65_9SPHN|nr:EthD domain-containing protein [Novosphingobium album (ex Hu et al. 2023)]MCJ2178075.1 EthD domain-containing protein [Novosphingobium album (ex Hu et al. 2023)]
MVTIHYCLRRKPGMSFEDFSAYWRGPHAELVRSIADKLGIVRYVQNHAILPEIAAAMKGMRGTSEPFDGVAAISFATPEDLARGNTDPEAAEAQGILAQDEAEFIDIPNSVILFTQAHEVIG